MAGVEKGRHPASGYLRYQHVIRHRMKAARGGEGGAALFQRRRDLAGTGVLPVPERVDQVLHGLAWHVGTIARVGVIEPHQATSNHSAVLPGARGFLTYSRGCD